MNSSLTGSASSRESPLSWSFSGYKLILLLMLPLQLFADVAHWQDFDIHFTTINSMLIPSEVATAHNIVRSEKRIITNISIRRDGKAIAAKLTGTSSNLFGQLFTLEFDEITEPGAIYYLSNQLIDERDRLIFKIDITPVKHPETYRLQFIRQYY